MLEAQIDQIPGKCVLCIGGLFSGAGFGDVVVIYLVAMPCTVKTCMVHSFPVTDG